MLPRPIKYIGVAGHEARATTAATSPHLIAITDDGSVYITGNNVSRQIGPSNSHSANFYSFIPVPLGTPTQAV
jgi:alpha-tubulin suppressor-like RCC1 family protein